MSMINLNKKLDTLNVNYSRKPKKSVGLKSFFVMLLILLVTVIIPVIFIYFGINQTFSNGRIIVSAYKSQNFDVLKKAVSNTKSGLQKTNIGLSFLSRL